MATDNTSTEQKPAPAFGTEFADQMAICEYHDGSWGEATLQPTKPLDVHPGAHVLHYSSSCFEGLKAFRTDSGEVKIFRLDKHVARMRQSAELVCLPAPPEDTLTRMICEAAAACKDAVPPFPGSLYLRPTLIGTEVNIGAAATASTDACLYVLVSPVGDYFRTGPRPLRIAIEEDLRTTPDFGMAKTGVNYALAMRRVIAAKEQQGADQVLFCPNGDVQETGAANFLLISDKKVLTKALDSTYLHGVTRDSLLRLAPTLGYDVEERDISVAEVLDWARTGEAALSGTAAVLAGIGSFVYNGTEHAVRNGEVGPNTQRLRQALMDIQRGEADDQFGWLTAI